ncbi:ATP-binding protein [Methylotuvimicrobium alcaliphilum]|uniref:ATPase n=1 Tax=Methylotuvimicrobium alcaliphilum (strain DSM 19304 / NCIMB 14124 / VKM B-2133 / 20Z) TaxID=1091494 RepID=G4ST46_META2|nr:ATP-binding protein [Methylotuvimicrobium alcaliphilum]CCE22756.1 ATPase [Methylotuvimicrobium alcaliphilum 20Z]
MDEIVGLIGRDEVVGDLVAEIKKGKHVILTGPVGIGKSAVLRAALDRLGAKVPLLIRLHDHQAKGQFVDMARQMLALDLVTPKELELPAKYHDTPGSEIDWKEIKSQVNRMSMRDLTHAVIPALARAEDKPVIAVDDLTSLTPTQMAFWLAIFDHAQVIGCASEKKARVRKLWWKMREIGVKPLPADTIRAIVKRYIETKGILIESPELYISHVVKQSGGVPQAIYDMLDESGKERIIDKRKVREMRHEAGVQYLDFTPMVMVLGALIVSMRYVGMGTGDKTLYIMGGIGAALFLTFRFFIFKGVGR